MMSYAVLSAFYSLKTMGHWNPQKRAYFEFHQKDIDQMTYCLYLCRSMIFCIMILIVQHIYFILTCSSSIEFGCLVGVNPFFLGERKSEKKLYEKSIQQNNDRSVPMKLFCYCFSFKCFCSMLDMSYKNWLTVFEKNPLLWLIPYRFEQ